MKHSFALYLSVFAISGCAAQQSSAPCNGDWFDDAHQLRGRLCRQHDNRLRRDVGGWSGNQHERRQRLAIGRRRVLELPELRCSEFDHLQRPRATRLAQPQPQVSGVRYANRADW